MDVFVFGAECNEPKSNLTPDMIEVVPPDQVILVSQWAPYNSMAPLALEPAEAPIDVGAERVA